jgi:hypothetical protein
LHKKTNAVPIDELDVNIPMFTGVIESDGTIDHIALWLMHKEVVPLRRGTKIPNEFHDKAIAFIKNPYDYVEFTSSCYEEESENDSTFS